MGDLYHVDLRLPGLCQCIFLPAQDPAAAPVSVLNLLHHGLAHNAIGDCGDFRQWSGVRYDQTDRRGQAGVLLSALRPDHPQTQDKIERWHQTLKNRILLENYFLPGDLEAFVDHYNHRRYHENLNNVTPAHVSFGRDKAVLQQREKIKRKTLETRR